MNSYEQTVEVALKSHNVNLLQSLLKQSEILDNLSDGYLDGMKVNVIQRAMNDEFGKQLEESDIESIVNEEIERRCFQRQIPEMQSKIDKLRTELQTLESALQNAQEKGFRKQDYYYRILCKPSRSDYVIHHKGLFSRKANAERYIPGSGSSTDTDDNCTWYYQVVRVPSAEISSFEGLDKRPDNFPYTGW